jgi:MYXO-CTERM domain-containing protein
MRRKVPLTSFILLAAVFSTRAPAPARASTPPPCVPSEVHPPEGAVVPANTDTLFLRPSAVRADANPAPPHVELRVVGGESIPVQLVGSKDLIGFREIRIGKPLVDGQTLELSYPERCATENEVAAEPRRLTRTFRVGPGVTTSRALGEIVRTESVGAQQAPDGDVARVTLVVRLSPDLAPFAPVTALDLSGGDVLGQVAWGGTGRDVTITGVRPCRLAPARQVRLIVTAHVGGQPLPDPISRDVEITCGSTPVIWTAPGASAPGQAPATGDGGASFDVVDRGPGCTVGGRGGAGGWAAAALGLGLLARRRRRTRSA